MDIKQKFYRTYLVKVKTPKGVFWYAGKHESYHVNPYEDKYPGSGKILWNIYRKYGFNYKIKWSKCHGTRKKSYDVERDLIAAVKNKHPNTCINISPGGPGGEGIKWTERQRMEHKLRLNNPETKQRMREAQKIAQNKEDRKARQSEVMKEFYANGGNKKVSEGTSRAQRIAPHWHEPLKTEIYNIWISLGKPTTGPVVKALKGKYDVTSSALKKFNISVQKGRYKYSCKLNRRLKWLT
ncbi:putative homing endonuclease [Klebsiella phage vB_KaeM_Merci]|nr:putative homing endonuclease [Klebsiella phage vB_KaeM_Merci]